MERNVVLFALFAHLFADFVTPHEMMADDANLNMQL